MVGVCASASRVLQPAFSGTSSPSFLERKIPHGQNIFQPQVERLHPYDRGSGKPGNASLRMAEYHHPDGESPTLRILQDGYPHIVSNMPVASPSQTGMDYYGGEYPPQTYPTDTMQRVSNGQSHSTSGGGPVACNPGPPHTSRLRPVSELRMCRAKSFAND